jgi:hypothetical protein
MDLQTNPQSYQPFDPKVEEKLVREVWPEKFEDLKTGFPNMASEFVYIRSYSRWLEDEGRREKWEETVERYINFIEEERGNLIPKKVIKKAREAILNFKVMPSMRTLWTAGPAAKRDNTVMYNCLGIKEKFITDQGVMGFSDFKDGDKVTVLTHTGQWKKAKVKSYGEQELYNVHFRKGRGGKHHVVQATENHRWILSNGEETTNLRPGDVVMAAPNVFGEFDYRESTPDERMYWCYGYVYGDGTKVKDRGGNYRYSMVRLCGLDAERFKGRFEEMGFKTSTSDSLHGDWYAYTGTYLKVLPDLKVDSPAKIRAFIAGWMDADGAKSHNNKSTRFTSIQVTGLESYEWLMKALPVAGMYVVRVDDFSYQETNFGVRGAHTYRISVNENKHVNSNAAWVVADISQGPKETVWCLEVDEDHSFVMPFGIVTGNCSFQVIDSIDSFAECLYVLMCGTGYGFSVEQKYIDQLPEVPQFNEIGSEGEYVIEDSKEGWANSVKCLLRALYRGRDLEMNYSQLRPKGAKLKTMGGRSSGPAPLVSLHSFVRQVFQGAQGRKLTTLECHDILNQIAEIVVVGGVRRSSQISLSDLNDDEMAKAKSGIYPRRRSMANNSAVYTEKPTAVEFLKEWSLLASSGTGERGIFNLAGARAQAPRRRNSEMIAGTNPCKPLNSLILTENGYITFKQALELKELRIIDRFGNSLKATKPFQTDSNREIVRIELSNGSYLYSTPNHKHMTHEGDWKRVDELEIGEWLAYGAPALYPDAATAPTSEKRYDKGLMMGWIHGDGWFSKRKDSPGYNVGMCFGVNELDVAERFERLLGVKTKPHEQKPDTCRYFTSHRTALAEALLDEGMGLDKSNLEWLYGKDRDFKLGFLQALFTADGSVRKQNNVELYSTRRTALEVVSNILKEFGIYNTISVHNYARTYMAKDDKIRNNSTTWKINVYAGQFKRIGFISKRKNALLEDQTERSIYRYADYVSVRSIEREWDYQDVYDITVDSSEHSFIDTGVVTHNCGEIMLRDKGFCNLTEVIVRPEDDLDDLLEKVETATWLGAIQSTFTYFPYLSKEWTENAEEERLLGVSITGQMDNPRVLTPDALGAMKSRALKVARKASKILGINVAASVTCTKPSGSVSQLVNSASGVHARYSPFYIRRYRINGTDPLLALLLDQGMKATPENGERRKDWNAAQKAYDEGDGLYADKCRIFKVGEKWSKEKVLTWVVSFPVKSPDGAITRQDLSAIKQLEHYKKIQSNWCEHNASCFTGDTRFVSEEGLRRFDEFENGEAVSVLNGAGKFVPAKVLRLGNQEIYELTLQKGPLKMTIQTTKDHKWPITYKHQRHFGYKQKIYTTDQLPIGKQLNLVVPKEQVDGDEEGILHGITFGDGTFHKKGHYRDRNCLIALCDDSRVLKSLYKKKGYTLTERDDINQTRIYGLPGHWKQLPAQDSSREYVKGFIAGWFAADGHVSKDGKVVTLASVHKEYLEWLQEMAPVAGLAVSTKIQKHKFTKDSYSARDYYYVISFLKDGLTKDFFVHEKKRSRYKQTQPSKRWTIKEVRATNRIEPVYCIEEPVDHMFVLEGNILTHNCTVYVKDEEWFEVGNWVYQNWDIVNGLSFLPYDGGKYEQAPFEEITKEKYNELVDAMPKIDYTQLSKFELEDQTEGSKELACAGGVCEI